MKKVTEERCCVVPAPEKVVHVVLLPFFLADIVPVLTVGRKKEIPSQIIGDSRTWLPDEDADVVTFNIRHASAANFGAWSVLFCVFF